MLRWTQYTLAVIGAVIAIALVVNEYRALTGPVPGQEGINEIQKHLDELEKQRE